MAQARSARAMKTRKKKRGSITCRTDRANEANNMFIIWLGWLFRILKRWSRARGPYGYLRTWNWPITAREISQPYNKSGYFRGHWNNKDNSNNNNNSNRNNNNKNNNNNTFIYTGGILQRWHSSWDSHYCHTAVHTNVMAVTIITSVTSVVVTVLCQRCT